MGAVKNGLSGPARAKLPMAHEEETVDPELDMSETKVTPGLWTIHQDGEVLLRLSKHGAGHETPMTIPAFFRESVSRFGAYPALATKNSERWETLNFNQYYEACRKAARALIKLGLQRFHGVGILGFNSVEWFIASLGAILAGGLCKILSIPRGRMETLKAIIQYKLPMKESRDNLYSWNDFMELGHSIPDSQLDQIMESQRPNQCAVIIYTSGTLGIPKGVMLSHDNITWTAGAAAKNCGLSTAAQKQEVVVSYLPLSHIAAQMMDIWVTMKIGASTYFAQPDALKDMNSLSSTGLLINVLCPVELDVRPYARTALTGVFWLSGHLDQYSAGGKAYCLPGGAPNLGEDAGEDKGNWRQILKPEEEGVFVGKSYWLQDPYKRDVGHRTHDTPISYRVSKALVFSKVKSALGLDRCHSFISGAAPLNQQTAEFFLSLDIPIGEMYGMSESSGPHTASSRESYRIQSSCGKVMDGCKNMLYQKNKDSTGEICIWGRHVFMGYLDMEDRTMEIIDDEGWLHTGDLGYTDNQGFLYITGRIKEILITAGGENVAPIPIENMVKEKIPIISHAMLVGEKANFLSILLTLKCKMDGITGEPLDELSSEAINFCRKLGSHVSTVSEILELQDPLVYKAIQEGIDAVNEEAISNAQRIQKWAILEKDFSVPSGELGPTTKVRRHFVAQKYKRLIESFYY
ncbi:long-chain-fatty-acid--CoA ligase ACSBG2 isoform X3 [Prionailurus iriomotensis]